MRTTAMALVLSAILGLALCCGLPRAAQAQMTYKDFSVEVPESDVNIALPQNAGLLAPAAMGEMVLLRRYDGVPQSQVMVINVSAERLLGLRFEVWQKPYEEAPWDLCHRDELPPMAPGQVATIDTPHLDYEPSALLVNLFLEAATQPFITETREMPDLGPNVVHTAFWKCAGGMEFTISVDNDTKAVLPDVTAIVSNRPTGNSQWTVLGKTNPQELQTGSVEFETQCIDKARPGQVNVSLFGQYPNLPMDQVVYDFDGNKLTLP